MISDIKTATITSKGQIAIPKEMRSREGFREGQKIAILTFKDRIELRPLDQITDKLLQDLPDTEIATKPTDDLREWKRSLG